MSISSGEWCEYEERYGLTLSSLVDLRRIQQAEVEIAQCDGCRGLPCKKAANQFQVPFVDKAASNFVSWHVCKWSKILRLRKACRLAKIPAKYDGKTLRDFIVKKDNEYAVRVAQRYIRDKPPKGLFFYGGYGTGKTFLASIIANEYINAGKSVIFGDMPELLGELKRTFDSKGVSTAELLDEFCECDLLIMDDVGAGKITDWSIDITYRLINSRYNTAKPTIVTSNLELDDLAKLIGGRIVSRLQEMCVLVFFGVEDRRVAK